MLFICLSVMFSMQIISAQDDFAYEGPPDWPTVIGPSGSEVVANYTDFAKIFPIKGTVRP